MGATTNVSFTVIVFNVKHSPYFFLVLQSDISLLVAMFFYHTAYFFPFTYSLHLYTDQLLTANTRAIQS